MQYYLLFCIKSEFKQREYWLLLLEIECRNKEQSFIFVLLSMGDYFLTTAHRRHLGDNSELEIGNISLIVSGTKQ